MHPTKAAPGKDLSRGIVGGKHARGRAETSCIEPIDLTTLPYQIYKAWGYAEARIRDEGGAASDVSWVTVAS